jgi:hypothetical protein
MCRSADAPVFGAAYSGAEVGRILLPFGSAPALLSGRAGRPFASGAALRIAPISPNVLVGVFADTVLQPLTPWSTLDTPDSGLLCL